MEPERFFSTLAVATEPEETNRAPARLKARIYSAVVSHQASTGPLLSLTASREAGRLLRIFEQVVAGAPGGDAIKSMNPCRVCHARYLAERLEWAPIYWAHCPYTEFHRV